MSMSENYGRPLLNRLVDDANTLGISIDFYIDRGGKYIIKTGGVTVHREKFYPPTAAAACFFVKGMISLAKVRAKAMLNQDH